MIFKTEAQTSVLKLADSLFVYGNYSKAIEVYKTYNNPYEVYDKIAKCYMAIGNYDEAIFNYRESVLANPNNLLLKYDFGKLLSRMKKFDEASEVFNELILVDSLNPNYYYELGLVQENFKDSLAQKSFLQVFQLDQTHQKAIFKIAKYNLKKRQYESVEKYVNIGLKSYRNNKELISLKAQNYYWEQDYRNAIIWFEKLIELGETSEFIHEKLSLSYAQVYEYEKAIEQRLLALKYNPDDATAMYAIGTYYAEINDFENAEKYISKSLLLMDKPLDAEYIKLGTVLNLQMKHKEAIKIFKKAIKEDPSNEYSNLYLAITLEAYYADYDAKIDAFERFKKKFPNSELTKFVDTRILELKKEKFLKENKKED